VNKTKKLPLALTILTLFCLTPSTTNASDKESREAGIEKQVGVPELSQPIQFGKGLGFGKQFCWEMVYGQKCLIRK